jgi:hypothetical protein
LSVQETAGSYLIALEHHGPCSSQLQQFRTQATCRARFENWMSRQAYPRVARLPNRECLGKNSSQLLWAHKIRPVMPEQTSGVG